MATKGMMPRYTSLDVTPGGSTPWM
jgi:hypothetical protein